jgi:integrase|tara:strand:+ start:92 stop:955 length:864 start_codon:yes stop_codon:yes gene_type:complete
MGCMRKRGKSWNAQVRVSGWRTFTKSFKTKLSATEWVANFEKELRSKPIPKKDIKNLKLKNLFNKYKLEILPKLKSYKIVSYKLINLSRSWLGDIVVINLTKRYLEQFCEDRKLKVQEGTVKSELMLIKRIFKIAIDKWNYGIPFDAFSGHEIPSSHKPRNRRASKEKSTTLIFNTEKQKNKYVSIIIQFAVETSMRRSKILKLTWNDINLETRIASLYDNKNGDDGHIPLTKTAIKLLSDLTQSSEFVFPISANCLRLAWERCRYKSNIKGLRFHDLRHEAVSKFF